ncbi:MAG: sensor histidine kinase [Clostridia bacterium]|nr:sensor histidine kinase [Clostridia bacterium]
MAICEILFSLGAKPRKWFKIPPWVTVTLAIILFLVFGWFFPYLENIPTLTATIVFLVSVLLQWAALDLSIHRVIFNSVGAYAVQNLGVNLRDLFFMLVDTGEWFSDARIWAVLFIRIAFVAVLYVACYFLFARQRQGKEQNIPYVRLYIISFITVFITNALFVFFLETGTTGMPIKAVLSICCLLALMLQYSAFRNGTLNKETAIMEQLLYREQKQHELTQATIDMINIKSHDLKRQIALFKQTYGDSADGMIEDVERAVSLYGDLVKTGNKNLDLVIAEEKIYCEKYGIDLAVMADGKLVDFISPYDIYSLFGNALRNAVESVMNEEEGKRFISFDMHEKGAYVCIEITNYCSRDVQFVKGRPITNKKDKNLHGYGVRSMEYIVEKYGGNMVIDHKDNTFIVKIILRKRA